MPMVRLKKEWEYGGEIRAPGTRLTVSKHLGDWLVREQIADPFSGVAEAAAPVTVAERRTPLPTATKQRFRTCGGCGW